MLLLAFSGLLLASLLGHAALRTERDVGTLLTCWIVFLYLVPARWVVGPLGGLGTPAMLLGLLAGYWWFAGRTVPHLGLDREPQPMRYLLFFYGWCMAVGLVPAMTRPLTTFEANGVGRSLVTLLSLTGIALLTADGIRSQNRLEAVLRRLVGVASAVAAIGILQSIAKIDVVPYLRVPGLTLNMELWTGGMRHGLARPGATALHPIEFSVVMSMVLPLAVHYALAARERGEQQRFWAATALIFAALPITLSRSGLLGLVVGMGVLAFAWTWRRRAEILGLGFLAFTGLWLTIPGLMGTIRGMIFGIEDDTSIQARREDIPFVIDLVAEYPWFGRGFGTYNIEDYLLLDNQLYKTAIEGGIVGAAALLALLLLPAFAAVSIRRHAATAQQRDLAVALIAGISAAAINVFTFDAFSYHIYRGTLFLLIGSLGALWRLSVREARRGHDPNLLLESER